MNNEAIKKIAENNGFDEASRQLFEEVAELIVASNKYHRNSKKPKKTPSDCVSEQYLISQIVGEIADVTIMIEQIKYLLGIKAADVEEIVDFKLNRQLERIEKNE